MRAAIVSAVFGLIAALGTGQARADTPTGWHIAGSEPTSYEIGTDKTTRHGGAASGFIKSKVEKVNGFGTVMQSFKPAKLGGKRVRLSGWIKTDKVSDWAGLWMRVDSSKNDALAFDNMGDRPIKGSKDWFRYEVVLDVDRAASLIAFGVLVNGTGTVWLDDVKFEVVDKSVPTTDLLPKATDGDEPLNLGFDQ